MKTYEIITVMFIILGIFPQSIFSRNNKLRMSKSTEFSFEEVSYDDNSDGDDDMDTAESFMAALTASAGQAQTTAAPPTFIMVPTADGQFVQPQVQVTQAPPVILPLVIPQQTLNNFRAQQQQQQFPRFVGGGRGMPRGRLVGIRPGGGMRGRRPGGGRLVRQRFRSQGLRQQQQVPQVLQPIVIQQQVPAKTTSAPSSSVSDVERIPIIHQHVFQVPPVFQSPIIQPQVIQQPIVTPSQSLGSSYSGQATIKEVIQQQHPHSGPQIQMIQTSYPYSSSYPQHTYVAAPTSPTIRYAVPASANGSHGAGVLSNTIVVQPHMSERERKKKRRREKMIKKLQAMMD